MGLPSFPSIELAEDVLFFLIVGFSFPIAYRATVWVFYRRGILDEYDPADVERDEWIRIAIVAALVAWIGSAVLFDVIDVLV